MLGVVQDRFPSGHHQCVSVSILFATLDGVPQGPGGVPGSVTGEVLMLWFCCIAVVRVAVLGHRAHMLP